MSRVIYLFALSFAIDAARNYTGLTLTVIALAVLWAFELALYLRREGVF